MSRLLCDLVDARSFLQGTVPLDLGRHLLALVLEEAVDDFELEAAARDITVRTTLHVPDDTLVACDRERLLQVLANLLGNAIKFSERGAEIEIRVRSAGARLEFDVSDRGAGIPAEDLPHVFEPYWTKSSTRQRGTGLGLAIVRSIVTAHGGDVRVASEVGVGTTFTFTMPADQAPA